MGEAVEDMSGVFRAGKTQAVKPPPFHASIRETEEALEIEVRRRSGWPMRLLTLFGVVLYTAGWVALAVGAISVSVALLFPGDVPMNSDPIAIVFCLPILLVVMIIWPFILLRAGWRSFIAEWTDREIMTAAATQWRVVQFIGPWRRSRHFATENVSNAHRVIRDHRMTLRNFLDLGWQASGNLAFRHKRARIAFAPAATEAEARQIMRALHRRFPHQCEAKPDQLIPAPFPEATPRWQLEVTLAGSRIQVPVRRRWATRAYMVFNILYSLALLVPLFWMMLGILASGDDQTIAPYLGVAAVLLAAMAVVVALMMWSLRELIWQLRGVEVVVVGEKAVMLSSKHLPLGYQREYVSEHVCALRHEPGLYHAWQTPGAFFRQPGGFGTIAFDYGAGTYRFGQDLTPAEANALVRQILDRFPQYGRDDMIPRVSDHTSS